MESEACGFFFSFFFFGRSLNRIDTTDKYKCETEMSFEQKLQKYFEKCELDFTSKRTIS